jgi:hypothetical protein
MKITNKNTALGLLDHIDVHSFRIIDDAGQTTQIEKTAMAFSIIDKWQNFEFDKKIQYLSEPFYNAYNRSVYKLADVLDKEPIDQSGTFIFRANASETNTIFYKIKTWGAGKNFEMDATVMVFNKDTHKDKPALGILAQRRPGMSLAGARFYASKKAIDAGITSTSVIGDIFTLLLFLKYCEVETKIISANKKEKHVGIKYVNETKNNIEVLDSSYFTTIIKSEGFPVNGHFRWQPYGPHLSLKKLIWIDQFEKTGYTRTAKVLNQNINNNE